MYDQDDMKFYSRQAYKEGVKDTEGQLAEWKARAEKAELELADVVKVLRRAYKVKEGQELIGKIPILIDALAHTVAQLEGEP